MLRALVICLALVACGDDGASEPAPPMTELAEGVRRGAGLYERRDFTLTIGNASDLELGRVAGDPRVHLVAVGTAGFELRDPETLELRAATRFPAPRNGFCAVDLDGDGALEFATFGGFFETPMVCDASGREVPCSRTDGPVTSAEPLRIGWQASHVHVLGSSGVERRIALPIRIDTFEREPTELIDTDHDGTPEIITIDGAELVVRGLDGTILRHQKPPDGGYVNRLELLRDFGSPPSDRLLVGHYVRGGPRDGQRSELYALDARTHLGEVEGDAVTTFAGTLRLGGETERWVRIDSLMQQAPVAGIAFTRQSVRVLDAERKTIFEEIVAAPGADTDRGSAGDVLPLPSPHGAFVAAYGVGLRLYTPLVR